MPEPSQERQTSFDVPEPLQLIHFLSFVSAEINEDIAKVSSVMNVRARVFDFMCLD
jgi:hypothetical protein